MKTVRVWQSSNGVTSSWPLRRLPLNRRDLSKRHLTRTRKILFGHNWLQGDRIYVWKQDLSYVLRDTYLRRGSRWRLTSSIALLSRYRLRKEAHSPRGVKSMFVILLLCNQSFSSLGHRAKGSKQTFFN